MKLDKINIAADKLFKARINVNRIKNLPKNCIPHNQIEAYKIQEILTEKHLSVNKKYHIIGKKIGCTNKTAQKQINVTEPFYGNLLSNYSSKNNCLIKSEKFSKLFVEPEFGFKIGKELNFLKAPFSTKNIYDIIDYVMPAIEIVDSRFTNWKNIGINNLIADNGVNGFWIYGKKFKNLDLFDFSNHSVSLFFNDKLIDVGNSANVLGSPINSLTWLINKMAKNKKSLIKGRYISTGTCTIVKSAKKNDNICADFGKLGKVKIKFI